MKNKNEESLFITKRNEKTETLNRIKLSEERNNVILIKDKISKKKKIVW